MDNSLKIYESINNKFDTIITVSIVVSVLLFPLFIILAPISLALIFDLKEKEIKRWKNAELEKLGFKKIELKGVSYRRVTLAFIDFKNNKTFKTLLIPQDNSEYNFYYLLLSKDEKKNINENINVPDVVDVKLLGVSQRYQEGYSFTVYSFRIKYCDGSIKAITVPEGSKLCISLLALQEILQQQRNISRAVNF